MSIDAQIVARSLGHAIRRTVCLLTLLLAAATSATVIDGFEFEDEAMAERYRQLIAEFRCPKCLNTNIAGSNAPIAVDLRRTVRRLLKEGETDDDIRDYLRARYGDFVLYDPPLRWDTAILWLAPLLVLLVALVVLRALSRRPEAVALSEDEQQILRNLGVADAPDGSDR